MINLLYPSQLLCSPIIHPVQNNMISHQLSCAYDDDGQILDKLQSGTAELGFISPLSYAKSEGNLSIFEDFIISSPLAGRNSLLFFKGKLEKINTIYFSNNSPMVDYHKIIARYVLGEIFNITADWNEVENLVIDKNSIETYQVIFLSGHLAYDTFVDFENYIDLTEEWSLKMGLPMVHLVLCGSRDFHNRAVIDQLKLAREIGLRNLMKISKAYANGRNQNWDVYFDLIDKNFRFFPEISDWECLQNLFQYMFYANEVDYLPEIHFYHPESS